MRTQGKHIPTDKWVKIWFSTKPNIFLNTLNKDRLQDFLVRNSDKTVTLIYSSHVLNNEGKEDLSAFSELLKEENLLSRVNLLDFDSDAFVNALINDQEHHLYYFALKELEYLNRGGNPAAASDIVRLLFPSYSRGIYTDFDVYVDHRLPKVNFTSTNACGVYYPRHCNDVVIVVDSDDSMLKTIQRNIEKAYGLFSQHVLQLINDPNECLSDYSCELEDCRLFYRLLKNRLLLSDNSFNSSVPALQIIKIRYAIEEILREKLAEDADYLERCNTGRALFIESAVEVTGPGIYLDDLFSNQRCFLNDISQDQHRLFDYISSQTNYNSTSELYRSDNDLSWFPRFREEPSKQQSQLVSIDNSENSFQLTLLSSAQFAFGISVLKETVCLLMPNAFMKKNIVAIASLCCALYFNVMGQTLLLGALSGAAHFSGINKKFPKSSEYFLPGFAMMIFTLFINQPQTIKEGFNICGFTLSSLVGSGVGTWCGKKAVSTMHVLENCSKSLFIWKNKNNENVTSESHEKRNNSGLLHRVEARLQAAAPQ